MKEGNIVIISDQDKDEAVSSSNIGNMGVPHHQNRLSLGGMVFGL